MKWWKAWGGGGGKGEYQPAALERAADSIRGVETHGTGISLPMMTTGLVFLELLPG